MKVMPTSVDKDMSTVKVTVDDIGSHLMTLLSDGRKARQEVESEWMEVDSIYADPVYKSKGYAEQRTGDRGDWKHKVNTAKCYEVVETLVAYFTNSTFPNADWFDVRANVNGIGVLLPVLKELLRQELEQCQIRVSTEDWLRNLVKYGTSTYRVSYNRELSTGFSGGVYDSSTVNVCCESPYDVWFDPNLPISRAGTFCRVYHSKADFTQLANTGFYTVTDEEVKAYTPGQRSVSVDNKSSYSSSEGSQLIEFYGRVEVSGVVFDRVHAVFLGNKLIRLANSGYKCGSPFVTATMLPRRDSHYGMSCLNPSLGILHTMNTLTNSRLDNIMLHINAMFEMVDDGIMDEDNIFTEPGKVFKVASKGNISRMDLGAANFTVTYGEQQFQENSINNALSVGPLVGSGQPRSGERVTAMEVAAVQDSGGNRLSCVHSRIEALGTVPMLNKCLKMLQQFVNVGKIVAVYDPQVQQNAYYKIFPSHLRSDIRLVATGATFVVEKERVTSELINLLDVAARSPELSARINYENIMLDLMKQMRFQDPSRYIKSAEPAAPEAAPPPDPTATLGGDMSELAYQQSLMSDGGESMATAMGLPTEGVPPEQLQQIMSSFVENPNGQPVNPDDAAALQLAGATQ
jgi:Bacteriophage head to tail connecting protein